MKASQHDFLETLFTEKYQPLYSYAYRSLNNPHSAEDVVMLTFSVAVKNVNKLMKSPNPDGWLMETLKHKIKHEMLSIFRRPVTVSFDDVQELITLDTPEPALVTGCLSGDEERLVEDFYGERKSVAEISQELHISESACKKRLQRVREKIKKNYDK